MAKKTENIIADHPLVAIDLGGGSVRTIAAECTDDGLFQILGVESSSRFSCVERGVVTNTSNAGYIVGELMKLLANRIHLNTLNKSFVVGGGQSMKIVEVSHKHNLVRKQEVEQFVLDNMDKECRKNIELHNPHAAVLDLVPSYYVLDGVAQDMPPTSTQRASMIEVFYIAFVGKKELVQKIYESFIRIPKPIERMYARPDALLCALATDEDLVNGCAILDLGAQTSTLTIFKGNKYLYNKVVSQGGYDITRAIEQFGISFAHAERLKCTYGWASQEMVQVNNLFRIPSVNPETGNVMIRANELATLIEGRLNQMLDPIIADLNTYADKIGVLYITGGGAMLNGIDAYIQQKTSLPVMYGSHAPWLVADTPEDLYAPKYSSLIGALILGNQNRENHPIEAQDNDWTRHFNAWKKQIEQKTLDIFLNN